MREIINLSKTELTSPTKKIINVSIKLNVVNLSIIKLIAHCTGCVEGEQHNPEHENSL